MNNFKRNPASFKDPSGFVFESEGKLYRQINKRYANSYRHLKNSGLYDKLVRNNLLIPHTEIEKNFTGDDEWFLTLAPERLEFISYPYEWCFDELKDAALLTLDILRKALDAGMVLKDATPYNVQLHQGSPIFIDTLSFEIYDPRQPWVAYRQFCRNFLFPLYLEYYLHTDIQKIMMAYMDGIPVDLTSKLLPMKSGLNLGVWLHVYLQNSVRGNDKQGKEASSFNKKKLLNMVSHLEGIIKGFQSKNGKSAWSNYYDETILGKDYLLAKDGAFREMLDNIEFNTALDLGANDGYFSKILAEKSALVVATDNDSRSISKLFAHVKKTKTKNIYPVVLDVANPTPALGFQNRERAAFHDRIKPDLVVALALVHHLVIGHNISLRLLAEYFHSIAPQLIIEFVPKDDEKVKQMLATREDVFDEYSKESFEEIFSNFFDIKSVHQIKGTERTLYSMVRKDDHT